SLRDRPRRGRRDPARARRRRGRDRRDHLHVLLDGASLRRHRGPRGGDVGPVRRRGDRAGHRRGRPGAGNPGRDRSERVHGSGTGGGAGAILRGRGKREEGRVTATQKYRTSASTSPGTVYSLASIATWIPSSRAASAVTGPIAAAANRPDVAASRPTMSTK